MSDSWTRAELLKVGGAGLVGGTLLRGFDVARGTEAWAAADAASVGLAPSCAAGQTWQNVPLTQGIRPTFACAPAGIADIQAIIREAESRGRRVHAFGSRWSFSDCAMTPDYMVDTTRLNRVLPRTRFGQALRNGVSPRLLVHVQAGMKLHELNLHLAANGLALQTMGGAAGQTIGGAISTGVHGGDQHRAPLADGVVALHLIGAGGRQYWIEGTSPGRGIIDPAKLKRFAPGATGIYDARTFNACLVSLGLMGVLYAVVLRVRPAYDLEETTTVSSWQAFKANAASYLDNPDVHFLQVLLDPYTKNNLNTCLVTTRAVRPATTTIPQAPIRADTASALQSVVIAMLVDMARISPVFFAVLVAHGSIGRLTDNTQPAEARLAGFVDDVLNHAPALRVFLTLYYPLLMGAQNPAGTIAGPSYAVTDLGFRKWHVPISPGYSIEPHFDASLVNGRRAFVDYVDELIATVDAATFTFFTGYISLRFTRATRASLGMQQWPRTGSIEIATLHGVRGLRPLVTRLYQLAINRGALPHWGQGLDLTFDAARYPRLAQWRAAYGRLSNDFTARTFENALSRRWKLTTTP